MNWMIYHHIKLHLILLLKDLAEKDMIWLLQLQEAFWTKKLLPTSCYLEPSKHTFAELSESNVIILPDAYWTSGSCKIINVNWKVNWPIAKNLNYVLGAWIRELGQSRTWVMPQRNIVTRMIKQQVKCPYKRP